MSQTTLSPNMQLPVPTVGQEPGPDYAQDINVSLGIIDQHTHAPGSGVPITPDAMNISSDLTFNGNSATNLAGLTLTAQGSAPSENTIYESGNDLYFVDGLGNNIRLTQSGAVAGTPGSISNLVAPASANYSAGSSTFVWQSNTGIAANMDFGAAILRNISPNSTFSLTLRPPAALGSNSTITLPAVPGSQSFMALDSSGNMSASIAVSHGLSNVNFATGAQIPLNVSTQTTDYTVATTDGLILVDSTSAAIAITLYTAVGNSGLSIKIKRTNALSSNIITISGTGGQTIGGNASFKLCTQNESVTLVSDGANWVVDEHYIDSKWNSGGVIGISAVSSNPTKGTTTTDRVLWSRHGSSVRLRYEYVQTVGGSAGSGMYLLAIPSNIVIDTAKISASTNSSAAGGNSGVAAASVASSGWFNDNNSGSSGFFGTARVYDATNLSFMLGNFNGVSRSLWAHNTTMVMSSVIGFGIDLELPVLNWEG